MTVHQNKFSDFTFGWGLKFTKATQWALPFWDADKHTNKTFTINIFHIVHIRNYKIELGK